MGDPTRLDHLVHMATEEPSQLMPLSLAQAALIATLDARDLEPLSTRLAALLERPLPPRPDNRLRHAAGLRQACDLLGGVEPPILPVEDLVAAVEQVRGAPYLWESIADLALAYAIRVHGRDAASPLWERRAEAPLGEEPVVLTLLALAMDNLPPMDEWADREAGWLASHAALDMAGTARVATVLALAARHPNASAGRLRDSFLTSARSWATAMVAVDIGDPEWSIDTEGRLALGVQVSGRAEAVEAVLPCAMNDLVYRLPWHLDRLRRGALAAAEVRGARRSSDIARAGELGVELVFGTDLPMLTAAAIGPLRRRQDAGLRWLRERQATALPPLRWVTVPAR